MSSIISGLLGGIGSGILAPILGYFTTARNDDLAGFQSGVTADKDVAIATINARIQIAQLQASTNLWWGARLIILFVAGCCAAHFGAVMLDTTPLFGHIVGSWSVPKLPAPYDQYESEILLSFFVLTPTAPLLNAAASWLHRK